MFKDIIPEGTCQAKFMLSEFYPEAILPNIGSELGIQVVFRPGVAAAVNTVNMEAQINDDPKDLDSGSIAYDSYVAISNIINASLSGYKKDDTMTNNELKTLLTNNVMVWNAIKMFIANYYMYRKEIYKVTR